jgi:hypothetical protein
MLAKVDAMAEAGTLSATEAKKMRKLWSLQEQLLTKMSGGAVAGTDEEALVSAMHSVTDRAFACAMAKVPHLCTHR